MTTEINRRRNQYRGACCVCSCDVEAGEGWLYADTRASKRRHSGRWPKKVKCDRCHQGKHTHKWQVENLECPSPSVLRWSVRDVNRWDLEVETTDSRWAGEWIGDGSGYESVSGTLVTVHVTVGDDCIQLAGPDPILGRQAGLWGGYEEKGIGGRAFTAGAWKRLTQRVAEAVASRKEAAR